MTDETPNIDERFDAMVGRMPTTMAVITVAGDGERSGCMVGFHVQSGIAPRRYAVWVSKANHTYEIARRSEFMAVHFLGSDDHDLAELFGGETGDEVDKFSACDWTAGPGDVPLLDKVANHVVGRVVEWDETSGDHACALLEPVEVIEADVGWLTLDDVGDIDAGHA